MKKPEVDTSRKTIYKSIWGSEKKGRQFWGNHLDIMARAVNKVSREGDNFSHTAVALEAFDMLTDEQKGQILVYHLSSDVQTILNIINSSCYCEDCNRTRAIYAGEIE